MVNETQQETKTKQIQIKEENNLLDEQTSETSETPSSNNMEVLSGNYAIPKSEDPNAILKGGMDTNVSSQIGLSDADYKINWLFSSDEELVDKDKIIQRVKEYIENYNSEEFKQYKQDFKNLYQKYSNKRHIINETADTIIVAKNTEKRDVVMELTKPRYIFYDKDHKLHKMKQDISNERKSLKLEYDNLSSRVDVTLDERKDFEKQRKKFIDLLERYYIFTLYHVKINNIDNTDKQKILIQDTMIVNKGDDEHKIISGELYMINNIVIEQINAVNALKLDEYNTLISKLQSVKEIGKDKEIIEKIKQYLKREQNIELNNQLKNIKKEQDIVVNFIVSRLSSTHSKEED